MRAKLALALAGLAAALAAAEMFVRLAAPATPLDAMRAEEQRYLEREPMIPFFRLTPENGGTWASARPRARGESFPAVRPPGERLVFVTGESIAFRLPSEVLARALGAPHRVVNAGMAGYGARAVATTIIGLLDHDPSAVVVLAGNNGMGPEVGGALSALAAYSRLVRLSLDVSAPRAENDADFAAVLRSAANWTRARGATVVLCTTPVNLEEPPSGELPLQDPAFRRGWTAYEAGKLDEARKLWEEFAATSPGDPMGAYWLGRLHARRGRRAEARAAWMRALETDYPDRCKPLRNELIRRLAREEGFALADLEAAFSSAEGDAYLDEVHWRESWHPLAAATIARALGVANPPRAAAPAPAPLTAAEADDVLRRTLSLTRQAGAVEPLTLHERFVFAFERLWKQAPVRVAQILRDENAARALLSSSDWTRAAASATARQRALVLTHAGEARWRAGAREEGLALLRAALAEDAENPLTRRLLGQRLLAMGRVKEGRAAFAAVSPTSREAILASAFLAEQR